MALSDTQKAQIRLYLGYPDLFRYKNVRLEGTLSGNLSPEAETLITAAIAQLATIDAQLDGSLSTAGLKAVDEIEFFGPKDGGTRRTEICNQGRIIITRISTILGVPPYADYYGEAGYPGDTFSEFGLAHGRGTRIVPIG